MKTSHLDESIRFLPTWHRMLCEHASGLLELTQTDSSNVLAELLLLHLSYHLYRRSCVSAASKALGSSAWLWCTSEAAAAQVKVSC